MKKIIFTFAAMAVLVSCQKENGPKFKDGTYTYSFDASQEEVIGTRTVIDGKVSKWSGKEAVRVIGADNYNYYFETEIQGDPVATATFKYSGEQELKGFGDEGKTFYAVYPYGSSNLTVDDATQTISGINVPTTQTAVEGSYDVMAPVAVAYSTDGKTLAFKNVTALVKFQVLVEGVKKVTFSGNNSEPLSGNINVSYNNGQPSFVTTETTKTYVELICNDGFVVGKDYYFSILPNKFSHGFKIEINGIRARNLTKEKTIKRSSCLTDVTLGSVIPSVIYENGDWTISKGAMTDLGNGNFVKKGVTISASGFRIADGAALKSTIKTRISPETWYNIHSSQSGNMILEGTYDIYVHKKDYGMFCCVVNDGTAMPSFTAANKQLYIVLQDNGGWWTDKYLYSWNPDDNSNKYLGDWPGKAKNGGVTLWANDKHVYWSMPDSANDKKIGIIFKNSAYTDDNNQTSDIVISQFNRDYAYYFDINDSYDGTKRKVKDLSLN